MIQEHPTHEHNNYDKLLSKTQKLIQEKKEKNRFAEYDHHPRFTITHQTSKLAIFHQKQKRKTSNNDCTILNYTLKSVGIKFGKK